MMANQLKMAEINAIRTLHKSGRSQREIARLLGIHRDTVAKHLSAEDSKPAKHLVRITLSKLRLGIGDPTVLDALSVAKFGDKEARPILEEAYNKTSDLGFVAKTFWSKGIEAIKKVEPACDVRLNDINGNRCGSLSSFVIDDTCHECGAELESQSCPECD